MRLGNGQTGFSALDLLARRRHRSLSFRSAFLASFHVLLLPRTRNASTCLARQSLDSRAAVLPICTAWCAARRISCLHLRPHPSAASSVWLAGAHRLSVRLQYWGNRCLFAHRCPSIHSRPDVGCFACLASLVSRASLSELSFNSTRTSLLVGSNVLCRLAR